MKLPSSNIATETSGLLASNAFSVGDAGMILDILRTKIYSDPILAICREITCNARDAHREVGTPTRPIEVHFPNHWSTNLVIKDYGPGIDPSRMEDVFIKFGCSTKRDDNVQQGSFGLGCKTPLAYSDTFTVKTIVDNIKYTYSAYIDETKVGQMTLLQQEETSDENGTEIEIPISRNDYTTFINMIVKVTQHWDVKPELSGADAPAWKTYEYSYTGNRWKLPARSNRRRSYGYSYQEDHTSLALIDGIAYNIHVPSLVDATGLHEAVLNTGFHFTFGVGELSLAASRDSIHYDEDTQKALIERIDALIKEIVVLITGEIKNASTYIEACNAYDKVKETLNQSGLLDKVEGIQWQGNKIRLKIQLKDIGEWAKLSTYTYDSYDEKVKTSRRTYSLDFRKDNVHLYHHDIKSKSVPGYVMEHLLKTTSAETIQVVWTEDVPSAAEYTDAIYRAKTYNKPEPVVKYDKDLMKLMGFKSLQEAVDSVPKEKKKARKSRGKISEGNIMGYTISCSYNDLYTTSTSFPLNQGGIFIQVDYKNKEYKTGIKSGVKSIFPSQVSCLATFLGETIVGFTEFRSKKLGSEWIPIWVAGKKKLDEELKNISVKELSDAGISSNYLFSHHMGNIERLADAKFRAMLNDCSPLGEYIDESVKVVELLKKYKQLVPILQYYDMDVEAAVDYRYNTNLNAAPNCKLALLYKAIKDRYPLMGQLRADVDSNCNAIVDYINLVDNKIEQKIKQKTNVFKLTGT